MLGAHYPRDVDLGLAGRRVVLIGAGGAIGQAVIGALRDERVELTLVSHRPPPAAATERWITADLAEAGQLRRLMDTLSAEPPDVLISLAAAPIAGRIPSDRVEELNRAMTVKVWGPAAVAETVGPKMAEAGWGRIVLTSGFAGREPLTDHVHGAINAAVRNLVKSFATRWAARGVTVNAVCPGPVHSERMEQWRAKVRGTERHPLAQGVASLPRRRDLDAAEVAAAIVFVASAPASGLNGTEVVVDGAATLGI